MLHRIKPVKEMSKSLLECPKRITRQELLTRSLRIDSEQQFNETSFHDISMYLTPLLPTSPHERESLFSMDV